jgi:hypothetical protein
MIKIVPAQSGSFLLTSCRIKNQSTTYSDVAITDEQQASGCEMILKHDTLSGVFRGY